jgi:hypothetical protein
MDKNRLFPRSGRSYTKGEKIAAETAEELGKVQSSKPNSGTIKRVENGSFP